VSFCRALLASRNRDIVILDDPFSSVDGLTGNWMFTHGVQEGLRGKIRIVALNSHLHLLKHFDRVLVLDEGKVALLVTPELLFSTHRDVYEQVLGSLQQQNHSSGEGEDVMDISDEISAGSHLEDVQLGSDDDYLTVGKPDVSARNTIESLDSNGDSDKDHAGDVELVGLPRKFSVASSQDSSQLNEGLIAAEVKTNDAISIYTYFSYFGAAFWNDQTTPEMARSLTLSSVVACSGLLFAFMIAQAMRVYCDVVLLQWVDEHEAGRDSVYFKLYLSCVASFIVLIALRSCVLSLYATAVCKSIHNMLFRKILNAPVPEFFDVTMVGNILNRFAKDMETTDVTIPEYLNMFLFQLFSLSSVVGLCIWSVPPFIVLVVPVVIFVVYMFLRFAPFSRDIKRLESVSRTPVYSSFSETLTGKSFLLLINPSFLILSSDIWLQVWRQLEHMV
jgi:ABC-type multidrug transport system fused ATPase/permease subunit